MNHQRPRRQGRWTTETVAAVVVSLVLGAVLVPRFRQAIWTARQNQAAFALQTVQAAVAHYRAEHAGRPPRALEDLLRTSDAAGEPVEGGRCGPYLRALPDPRRGGFSYHAASGTVRLRAPAVTE